MGGVPGLELPRDVVGRPAVQAHVSDHLPAAQEGGHGLEQLVAGPQHPHPGGAEHLVAGEAEEVTAQLGDVGGQVGDVLGPVNQAEGAGGAGRVGELADGGEGAQHVGHGGEAEELGPVQQPVEIGQVEGVVVGHGHEAQLDAALLAQDQPRHQVGVVLDLGEHHHVAGRQVGPAPAVGHQVEGLGHVLGEHHAVGGRGADEPGHLAPGRFVAVGGFGGDAVDAPVHVGVGRLVDRRPWRRAPSAASATTRPSPGRRWDGRPPRPSTAAGSRT